MNLNKSIAYLISKGYDEAVLNDMALVDIIFLINKHIQLDKMKDQNEHK